MFKMAEQKSQKQNQIKKVEKVWGYEEWIENNDRYCIKRLAMNPGFISSYHLHKIKDELFYFLEGRVYFNFRDGAELKKRIMVPGDWQRITPGNLHEFASLNLDGTPSVMLECSTHHEDSDSYRASQSRSIDLKKLIEQLRAEGLEV